MKHVCAPFGGLVVAIVILAGSASAADHGPTIQIGRDRVALDDRVQVRGDHWPVGDLVNIELYGNDALDASADCDLRNSVSFAVRESGAFFGTIQIAYPPKPCPCVIRVSSAAVTAITVPIDFPSAGFEPAEQRIFGGDIPRLLDITALELHSSGKWPSWFGASADRVADIVVTNDPRHHPHRDGRERAGSHRYRRLP